MKDLIARTTENIRRPELPSIQPPVIQPPNQFASPPNTPISGGGFVPPGDVVPSAAPAPPPKPRGPSRRALMIVVAVLVLGSGATAWAFLSPKAEDPAIQTAAKATPTPTPVPTPVLVASPLTGLLLSAEAAAAPLAGVMVENLYPDARPQSGLGDAGVVYEALAEGGITRMLALFQAPYPASIGPVRSLRPYYLDWGLEHDAPVAHAGGSEPALAAIKPLGLKDINALAYDGKYFVRTRDKIAPHNMYTTNVLLEQVVAKLGFATPPTIKGWPRKADAPAPTPPHPTIRVPFSTAQYLAEYRYHAPTNGYLRFQGGAAQVDRNSGKQIEAKNLIVQLVPLTYGTQSNGKTDTQYKLIGNGTALIFIDGGVVAGRWIKSDHAAPTQYVDAQNQPISLNRGNTWVSVVPTGINVTY